MSSVPPISISLFEEVFTAYKYRANVPEPQLPQDKINFYPLVIYYDNCYEVPACNADQFFKLITRRKTF